MIQCHKFVKNDRKNETFVLRYGQDVDIFRQFKKISDKNKDNELKINELRINIELCKFILDVEGFR